MESELKFAIHHIPERTPAAGRAALESEGDSRMGPPRRNKPNSEHGLIRVGDGVRIRDPTWYRGLQLEAGMVGRVAAISATCELQVTFDCEPSPRTFRVPSASLLALAQS